MVAGDTDPHKLQTYPQRPHSAFSQDLFCVLFGRWEMRLTNKVFRREGPRNTVGQVSLRAHVYLSLAPKPLKYKAGEEEGQERKNNHTSFENSTMGLPPHPKLSYLLSKGARDLNLCLLSLQLTMMAMA